MNVEQAGLLATVERKQKLMSAAPEDRRAKICMEISILDDRISAEEVELFEGACE